METNKTGFEFSLLEERSQENLTTSLDTVSESFGPGVIAVNCLAASASLVIFLCEILSIGILQKCTRLPRRCIFLSMSFLLSDAIAAVLFFIHQLVIFGFGYYNDLSRCSRIVTVGVFSSIAFASAAALSLERIITLKANIKYYRSVKMLHVHIATVLIWLLHCCVFVTVLVISFDSHCKWDFSRCNFWKVTRAARFTMFSFMVVHDIVLVVTNTMIFKIILRHHRTIKSHKLTDSGSADKSLVISRIQCTTAETIVKIVTVYLILQIPMTINVILTESSGDSRDEVFQRVYRAFSYFCIQSSSFLNIYLYVGKFQECKMHFYQILGKFSRKFEVRAEVLRYSVFNIVTREENVPNKPLPGSASD